MNRPSALQLASSPVLPPASTSNPTASAAKFKWGRGGGGAGLGGMKGLGGLRAGLKAEMASIKAASSQEAYAKLRIRASKAFLAKNWPAADDALSQQIDECGGHKNAQLYR